MTYPRVSHLSDNRQIASAINQALKLGESAGTGTGTGTVTTTGTPASGNLAKFSGSTSITNADLTGDVTTSGALATTIATGAVTLAKMANMATASLIYRKTAGAGAPEVNSLATLKTDLGLTGTNSGDQTITLTGDVTGSGTGSFAATLAASGVTAGTYGDSTHSLTVTVDAKGRITGVSTNALSSTFSGAKVRKSATLTGQNLTGGLVDVTFDTEDWDTDSYHSVVSNTQRMTVPSAGKYAVIGNVHLANITANTYFVVQVNRYNSGGTLQEICCHQTAMISSTGNNEANCAGSGNFAAGDYAVLQLFAGSDTSVDIHTDTFLEIRKLS